MRLKARRACRTWYSARRLRIPPLEHAPERERYHTRGSNRVRQRLQRHATSSLFVQLSAKALTAKIDSMENHVMADRLLPHTRRAWHTPAR